MQCPLKIYHSSRDKYRRDYLECVSASSKPLYDGCFIKVMHNYVLYSSYLLLNPSNDMQCQCLAADGARDTSGEFSTHRVLPVSSQEAAEEVFDNAVRGGEGLVKNMTSAHFWSIQENGNKTNECENCLCEVWTRTHKHLTTEISWCSLDEDHADGMSCERLSWTMSLLRGVFVTLGVS